MKTWVDALSVRNLQWRYGQCWLVDESCWLVDQSCWLINESCWLINESCWLDDESWLVDESCGPIEPRESGRVCFLTLKQLLRVLSIVLLHNPNLN